MLVSGGEHVALKTREMIMKIRLLLGLLLLTGSTLLAAKPPAAPAQPAFGETMEVNVVNVEVYATAKDGSRVTGLKKEDFTVLEDGKPVEITNFAAIHSGGATVPDTPAPPAGSPEETTVSPFPAGRAAVAASGAPLSLVVFVDNFYIRPANRARAVEQIRRFLADNVRPGDQVMLATHDLGLHVRQKFTDKPEILDATLREIEVLPTYGDEADRARNTTFRSVLTLQEVNVKQGDPCSPEVASPVEGYAQSTRQEVLRSLQSLTYLVNSLAGIPGRKALLHVSDGLPVTPGEELFQVLFEMCGGGAATSGLQLPEEVGVWDASTLGAGAYRAQQALLDAQKYSTAKELSALIAHANANRVTFYTLQASGLQGYANAAEFGVDERLLQLPTVQNVQTTNLQNSLSALAADTGGRAILNANQFLPDLARMREDFESYYSVGYTPPHNGDGREHKIAVKVNRPGLRLRYRQSYRDKPTLEKVVDRTLSALLYGIEDNPLDIKVEIGEQTAGPPGVWTVPVKLRIPLFKLAILNHEDVGIFEGNLKLFVATHTPDGGSSPLRQVAVPIRIPRKQVLNAMGQYYVYTLSLQLKPGPQQVAVAVRDEIGATTSYLSRNVEVGDKVTPSSR
jgi:VWFA-related protein